MRKGLVLAALLAPLAAACASMQTVAFAPMTEGVSTVYEAPYESVTAAAVEAVEGLDLTLNGTDETPQRFQIRFSQPINLWTWGEVGVVNVIRVDDGSTRVYVNTERVNQNQIIGGTSERRYAERIFAGIRASLGEAQP